MLARFVHAVFIGKQHLGVGVLCQGLGHQSQCTLDQDVVLVEQEHEIARGQFEGGVRTG